MNGIIKDCLPHCKTADFGKCKLSKMEKTFYRRFSYEMVSLCRSLPKSVQTEATLFLMRYSGLNLGDELDFFANYYPPIWSMLYWLGHDRALPTEQLKDEDVTNAVSAQSMAMFLHCLDDHLTDRQVVASHLALLLRSEAWATMGRAWCDLAEGVPAGERTVRRFINEYYSSIHDSKGTGSLDSYCRLFRKQMATLMIAPTLLSMRMTGISDLRRDIEIAYGSFGIAWRLLDDIRDIAEDMDNGAHSAIYVCLPKELRTHWNGDTTGSRAAVKDSTGAILDYVLEHCLVDKIKARICAELETAASIVETHGMTRLAREFRCLAHPLRNSGIT